MTATGTDDRVFDMAQVATLNGLETMQAIVEGRLPQAPIALQMNFRLVSISEGCAVFEGTPGPDFRNPMGTIHGGWYGAILDSALACAVHSRIPAGVNSTTLEYKVNIARAIPVGTRVRAEGTALHVGRRTGVADARLTGIDDGKLYATGSTTCIILA